MTNTFQAAFQSSSDTDELSLEVICLFLYFFNSVEIAVSQKVDESHVRHVQYLKDLKILIFSHAYNNSYAPP